MCIWRQRDDRKQKEVWPAGAQFHRTKKVIDEQELKLYWIADQIQVDKKTVSRWVNGKVKWIRTDNLASLSKLLECSTDRLLADSSVELVTDFDSSKAAAAIEKFNLLEELTPSGNYSLAECLLKVSLKNDLPLATLGDLYNQLCISCWQQEKFQEASLYASRVLELGEMSQNDDLKSAAHVQNSVIASKLGRINESLAASEKALAIVKKDNDHRRCGWIYYNRAVNYFYSWEITKGEEARKLADEAIARSGTIPDWRYAVIYQTDCLFAIFAEDFALARSHLSKAREHSKLGNYKRGKAFTSILAGVLLAVDGNYAEAIAGFEAGIPELKNGDRGIYEALGAMIYRLAGQEALARKWIDEGLKSYSPLFRLRNMEQLILLEKQVGSTAAMQAALSLARETCIERGYGGYLERLTDFD